jgi:hypothetical protein
LIIFCQCCVTRLPTPTLVSRPRRRRHHSCILAWLKLNRSIRSRLCSARRASPGVCESEMRFRQLTTRWLGSGPFQTVQSRNSSPPKTAPSPNRLKRNSYRTGRDFAATRLHPRRALRSCRHVVASACPAGGLHRYVPSIALARKKHVMGIGAHRIDCFRGPNATRQDIHATWKEIGSEKRGYRK